MWINNALLEPFKINVEFRLTRKYNTIWRFKVFWLCLKMEKKIYLFETINVFEHYKNTRFLYLFSI